MKKLLALILFSGLLMAQAPVQKISTRLQQRLNASASAPVLAWVFLNNKTADLTYYNQHPEMLVTKKSVDRRKKVFPADRVFETTDLPVSQEYIKTLENEGFKVNHISKWFNAVSGYITLESANKIAALKCVNELDLVEQLRAARPVVEENTAPPVNDNQPVGTYALSYGASLTQNQQINVPAVHNLGYFGQGVYVAVLDAGFNRLSHESFSTMNIIAKYDFVNHDPGVGDSTDMGTGTHGTQTLSTIGGYKSGSLIGPAFQSTYILAKTENTDSETPIEEDNWIRASEWADSLGADVITSSLGYTTFDAPYTSYTYLNMDGNFCRVTRGADLAVKKGIVVCNSAGNDGMNTSHNTLGAPADGDSVIAVGAVTSSGARASFSSVGNTVDGRTKPDVSAMGSGVTVASPSVNTSYTTASGTSFSCPLAAGVAALVLSARPGLTPMQVRDVMRKTASIANAPTRELGWGILNALAAIQFPLPVELVSFTATRSTGGIWLRWATATELNNKGFEVQKSSDKNSWKTLSFIGGQGTTTQAHEYSFTDTETGTGFVFYRIRQIDFDGTISYSDVVTADNNSPVDFTVSNNYPNPFNPSTKFSVSVAKKADLSVTVVNALGSQVAVLYNGTVEAGSYPFTWNAGSNSAGVYFLSVSSGGKTTLTKMTLLK